MAGRKPKNDPMTQDEMIEYVGNKRNSSKLYKAEVRQMSDDGISKSVHKAITIVKSADTIGRMNLEDTDRVKTIVGVYLETCANESVIPSMSDIAMCLGYTREALYYYMKRKGDTETGRFLRQMHDIIANTLADNALKGNVNNIVSIFLFKAMYGFREADSIDVNINQTDFDETDEFSMEQMRKKYAEMLRMQE